MPVLFIYNAAVAAFACLILLNAIVNFFVFAKPRAMVATGGDAGLPLVSILVPARNEEDNIEACVRSLLELNYPNFEVVVLDDGSEDSTYARLCRLRDRDYRLRVLVGSELPEGWYGKPHACWQLAQAARGDYLLFTDADCTLAPDAVLMALGALIEHKADAVSLYPDVRCTSFWDRLILPMMGYIVVGFLPILLVRGSRHHWFSPCNGAFIFLPRATYFDVDGHRAVRDQMAEDIKFAQNLKRRGKALWYGDGSSAYTVRMYRSFAEIIAGFSKNIYPAFDRKFWLLAFVLACLVVVFVLPPLWAVYGYLTGARWMWLPMLTYIGLVGVRLGLTARFGNDGVGYALLLPVAWAMTVAIAIRSIVVSSSGAEWKGRSYPRS
jgi:chlorobactene glucosyltransferase